MLTRVGIGVLLAVLLSCTRVAPERVALERSGVSAQLAAVTPTPKPWISDGCETRLCFCPGFCWRKGLDYHIDTVHRVWQGARLRLGACECQA